MKKLAIGFAAAPLLAGVALAAQPLSDEQMDRVTAGYNGGSALSTADGQALGKIVATATATAATVTVVTDPTGAPITATFGETTLYPIKSVSTAEAASSASSASLPITAQPGTNP
jgi:hypothetical protein